ncbi:hypothetical protein MIDIC_200011 [Alphaproteobacteria bacterium]
MMIWQRLLILSLMSLVLFWVVTVKEFINDNIGFAKKGRGIVYRFHPNTGKDVPIYDPNTCSVIYSSVLLAHTT